LWPFDDVKTLQEENIAKHCKENSAKRTGAQRPFLEMNSYLVNVHNPIPKDDSADEFLPI